MDKYNKIYSLFKGYIEDLLLLFVSFINNFIL